MLFSKIKNHLLFFMLLSLLFAVLSGVAWAKKSGRGQTGNGGTGGGNDSPDPEYSILADAAEVDDPFGSFTHANLYDPAVDCLAYNPDLKGPGIAYGGYYTPYPQETCAAATTSNGNVIFLRAIIVKSTENGLISQIELRGRDANGVYYQSAAGPVADTRPVPVDGSDFSLHVHGEIAMKSCGTTKMKGNTVCDIDVGVVAVADLVYANLGF